MADAHEHYERHLGPHYLWMAGGHEVALAQGRAEIEELNLPLRPGDEVLDLGAGFGMHAIPLAERGARVTAIDFSLQMLRTLGRLRGTLPIRAVNDDLMAFRSHITAAPSSILCLGDTITHLPGRDAVTRLIAGAFEELAPGGVLAITFRDYSVPLVGDQRFIPVRADEDRLLTCFLEYDADAVKVHDVFFGSSPEGWYTRVSHYRKLRLSPDFLVACLESSGFSVRRGHGLRGMVRLVGQKP